MRTVEDWIYLAVAAVLAVPAGTVLGAEVVEFVDAATGAGCATAP